VVRNYEEIQNSTCKNPKPKNFSIGEVFGTHFGEQYEYYLLVGGAYGTSRGNFLAECAERGIAGAFCIGIPFLGLLGL